MEDLFNKIDKKGLKIVFGLEAQGHIPTIQKILNKWNVNEYDIDMTYCKHVWDEIGKEIGWCSFTAALSYFEWLHEVEVIAKERQLREFRDDVFAGEEESLLFDEELFEKWLVDYKNRNKIS